MESSGSDLLGIFAGVGAAATFVDNGGNNTIIFVNGNNTYVGDTLTSATSDTIAGGTGFDTINTGAGQAVVYGGTGNDLINLHDTIAVTTVNYTGDFNDYVYLADGMATVDAAGVKDAVLVSASGQSISGGMLAGQYTGVALLAGGGLDLVQAGAGTVSVFQGSTEDTITGGSGTLFFIGEAPGLTTIIGGTGTTDVFGAAGESLTWSAISSTGPNVFVAGSGNETLNGSAATGAMQLFGSSVTSAAGPTSNVLIGGSGNDTLVSGAGADTLIGGTGTNIFLLATTAGDAAANITLGDFSTSANNFIAFAGYTQAQIDQALSDAHTVSGAMGGVNTVFTLGDNTTVTVVGITSLTGHTFGG